MARFLHSVGTSVILGVALLVFVIEVVAPRLPPYAGPPQLRDTRSFRLPAVKRVRLRTSDGAVRIVTSETDEISVEVEIKLYALNDRADPALLREYLETLIKVERTEPELAITTEPFERPASLAVQVAYTIHVPVGTNIDIAGSNGNIWVAKGCGAVTVHSGNADIEILEPAGPVIAKSTNGRIRVIDSQASTTLETVNGNILAKMRDGVLDASSTNGTIQVHILGPAVTGCVANSENGAIKAFLGPDVSFTVRATAERGSVRSQFSIEGANGADRTRELSGTFGDGDTKLNLTTGNGSIWLARG